LWLFFTCIFTLIECLTCPQVSSSIFGPKIGHFGQPKKSEKSWFQPQTGLWTLFLMVRMFNWDNFHSLQSNLMHFRLVKIDFFDLIKWQKHLLLSVVTVFLCLFGLNSWNVHQEQQKCNLITFWNQTNQIETKPYLYYNSHDLIFLQISYISAKCILLIEMCSFV
jgi:hypothetical protein